jgi:hypothetical protein
MDNNGGSGSSVGQWWMTTTTKTAAAAVDNHGGAPPPAVPGRRHDHVSLLPTPPRLLALAIKCTDQIHGDDSDDINVGINGREAGRGGADQHRH